MTTAVDRPESDDLETSYMEVFGLLMDKLNGEYIKMLRELLAGEYRVVDSRQNAWAWPEFRKRLFGIEETIRKSKIFDGAFTAMQSVFSSIDSRIKRGIVSDFKTSTFAIPELMLKQPSAAYKDVVNLNTDLITTITKKQSELLSETVQKAVRGAKDFNAIVTQVMEQADKGKSYAQFVARDQAAKAYAAISEERQKGAGYPNFEWLCVNIPPTPAKNKGEVRPDHWHLNKQIFSWDNLPVVNGRRVKPGEEVNCRCKGKGTFRPVTATV